MSTLPRNNAIPVIDLFAGPGGLGEGFSRLHPHGCPAFKTVLSIEKDKAAHQTLTLRAFYRQFDRRSRLLRTGLCPSPCGFVERVVPTIEHFYISVDVQAAHDLEEVPLLIAAPDVRVAPVVAVDPHSEI